MSGHGPPTTSEHLTRVHDVESIEDLKPWRSRGVEHFDRNNVLEYMPRAVRGWEHLPLPECEPPARSEEIAGRSDAPRELSSRVYAAVLSAVIPPSQALETVDIDSSRVHVAEALRGALDVSLETHEAAMSILSTSESVKPPTPPCASEGREPKSEHSESIEANVQGRSQRDQTDEVDEREVPKPVVNSSVGGDADVEDVVPTVEEVDDPPQSSGGMFSCCFGGSGPKKPPKKAGDVAATSPSGPTDPLEVLRATSLELKTDVQTTAEEDIEAHTAPAIQDETLITDIGGASPSMPDGQNAIDVSETCVALAIALWDGWARDGCSTDGGPLQGIEPGGGVHLVVPPRGWLSVLEAFARKHDVPPTTIALAECAAISRRWDVAPEHSLISELHARLATSVTEIASGRATESEEALHVTVAADILPRAERTLDTILSPVRGADDEEEAARVRALTPILALCMPLDTPAPRFANFLHRAASRAALNRLSRDLSTPLPGEAEAAATVAALAIHYARDDETDAGSYKGAAGDASKATFSHVGGEMEINGAAAMQTSLHAGRDSKCLTLARLVHAIETVIECFPTDLAVSRALPSGVSSAPVAFHAVATTLSSVVTRAIKAAGGLWAPPYGEVIEALDAGLRRFHAMMRAHGFGSSTGLLTPVALDDLARPSLEALLVTIRARLSDLLRADDARERASKLPPTPIAPARGAMHSASLVDLFATLRDAYLAAVPNIVHDPRRFRRHASEVEDIMGSALRWYASEHERACLSEVRIARAHMWENRVESRSTSKRTGDDDGAASSTTALTLGFHTRLSNIHGCVASLRAFRDECPLLWRTSPSNSDSEESSDSDQNDEDSGDENTGFKESKEGDAESENTSFAELLRALRCSRASVIASATELLMDVIAPDFALAVLSPHHTTRREALERAFESIDRELVRMDSALAAGAFRLAAAAVHRAACAALERLVLHRAHDDVEASSTKLVYATSGGSLSATAAPLTETEHSRVVEVASAVREFLSVNGSGVPMKVLLDGEQRLRRLLNLWFTPTLEVVREYWRQMDIIETSGAGALMGAVRPEDGGGIGPLDLIQLLAQRAGISSDGEASHVVEEQLSTAVSCNAAAVLDLPPREVIVATFVCRNDKTTLAGRLFVTASRVGFSSCGVGPDHPHDMYISFAVDIDQIVRAFKGDAEYGSTPSLNLVLVEGRALQFECFVGGARARDLALENLRATAAANHPQAPFLVNDVALSPSTPSDIVLPPGESSRKMFACVLSTFHQMMEPPGTLFVTSAALLWLPSGDDTQPDSDIDVGLRIAFENVEPEAIDVAQRGWDDHVVTVGLKPMAGKRAATVRFIRLTDSSAMSLQSEIVQALTEWGKHRQRGSYSIHRSRVYSKTQ